MLTKSNVDRKLEARGDNSETKKIMQIAEKMSRDPDSGFEIQLLQGAKELFDKYGKPGETLDEFIDRIDPEILKRINLKDGSKVIDFLKYAKSREPEVKKIDLASRFTPGKTLASLTESERDLVNKLLRMTLGKKD